MRPKNSVLRKICPCYGESLDMESYNRVNDTSAAPEMVPASTQAEALGPLDRSSEVGSSVEVVQLVQGQVLVCRW